ncbi:RDD family protein [Pedobacter faecalis]|uniref:RDD family protein n=1 Tax=Pedobacter faecalis TaxID=3041495 RepID=UPI0025509F47|nr:RDD family protein [Pedobacter sp. ELA7]
MSSGEQYTIVVNGRPEGPYTLDQLRNMPLRAETFVRTPQMPDYKEAHEVHELRELFGFTYQQTAPQYFASFDQRLLAMVVDYFFVSLCYVVLALTGFIFIDGQFQRISLLLSGVPLIPLAKFLYSSIAEASEKQATIGKRLLRITVTDEAGHRISMANSFGRNLAKVCSVAPFYIGYLYSFLNKKQQCFHDLIAHTLVTKERLI